MKGDDHLQFFKGLLCFSTENLHIIILANQFIKFLPLFVDEPTPAELALQAGRAYVILPKK